MAKQFFDKHYMETHFVEKPLHRLNFTDLEGMRFGKITVHKLNRREDKSFVWWCTCDCNPSRYFMVVPYSLRTGATTSCGCNYKTNGGNIHETLQEFQKKVGGDWEIISYQGRKHDCVAKCTMCGSIITKQGGSFICGVACHCTDKRIKRRDDILHLVGYSLIKEEKAQQQNGEYIMHLRCKSCGVKKLARNTELRDLKPCLCKGNHANNGEPCAIYLLAHKEGKYCKIGRSYSPSSRLRMINSSGGDFILEHVWWTPNHHYASVLETTLHREFSEHRFDAGGFDGSTECFYIKPDELTKGISEIVARLVGDYKPEDGVLTKDVKIRNNYKNSGMIVESRSYHFKESDVCLWIPYKGYLRKKRSPFSSWEMAEECHYLAANVQPSRNLDKFKIYGVDGVTDSIAGWSRRTGIPAQTLAWRMQRIGMTMKEAINYCRPDTVIWCGGKMVKKRDLKSIIGVSWESVYTASRKSKKTPEHIIEEILKRAT